MPDRFGWGANGGDTLGDVKLALGGRSFGESALTYAISPAKAVVDCSKGDVFTFKMPASSVVKIGNPTNFDNGSEITFLVSGITTFGTIVWDTNYVLAAAGFATFSTAKSKSIKFKYVPSKGKFVQDGPASLSLAV